MTTRKTPEEAFQELKRLQDQYNTDSAYYCAYQDAVLLLAPFFDKPPAPEGYKWLETRDRWYLRCSLSQYSVAWIKKVSSFDAVLTFDSGHNCEVHRAEKICTAIRDMQKWLEERK